MFALFEDIKAIYRNDPACKNVEFLLYPSFHAMLAHRYLIYPLFQLRIPFLPRLFSQVLRFLTGIEIHPGASIKPGFFCDHGSGVVIGETVEIGRNCTLFHGVTLGGTGKEQGKRHPTIGDGVYIGHGASVMGPVTVGSRSKIGAKTVIVNRDVPSDCTVIGSPPRIVKVRERKTDIPLPLSHYRQISIQQEKSKRDLLWEEEKDAVTF